MGAIRPGWSIVDIRNVDMEFEVVWMAIYYEIRIAGAVPADALRGFEHLAADQATETVVRGPLPDAAALHGLLARLESAGIQLVGLRRRK
jgi:hypothetical protein